MAEITRQRTGLFLRELFRILINKPEGMPAKEVLAELPKVIPLTEYEKGFYPSAPKWPRIDKIVRFATIGVVKSGWMVKSKGKWFVTEEGKQAYKKITDPEEFFRESTRLYNEWRDGRPQDEPDVEELIETEKPQYTVEELEELAWEQIQQVLKGINPYEFQDLVADLLKAMGYYIYWVAPPGKDGGIDIIAYSDPLGAHGPRVKVQVKHKLESFITVEPIRAFMSVIGTDEIGLFVSSGGFTANAHEEARSQDKRKVTLIDNEALIGLWIEHYSKLSQEARQRLPLKPIYFPASSE